MRIRGFFVIRSQTSDNHISRPRHKYPQMYNILYYATSSEKAGCKCPHLPSISTYAILSGKAGRKCPHLHNIMSYAATSDEAGLQVSPLAHYIVVCNIIRQSWHKCPHLCPYFNKFSFAAFPFSDHNAYFCQKRSNEKSNAHDGTGIGLSLLYHPKYKNHYDRFAEKLEIHHQYL